MKTLLLTLTVLALSFSAFAEDSKYCNGQIKQDYSGTKYFPNGQKMSDSFATYYPNKQVVKDNKGIYFPNGQITKDSWASYYPNRQTIKDLKLSYYHTGQTIKSSFGECFFPNGQKQYPCKDSVEAKMSVSQGLTMTYKIDTRVASLSNIKFEESISGTRTVYELSLTDGAISNVEVFCD